MKHCGQLTHALTFPGHLRLSRKSRILATFTHQMTTNYRTQRQLRPCIFRVGVGMKLRRQGRIQNPVGPLRETRRLTEGLLRLARRPEV